MFRHDFDALARSIQLCFLAFTPGYGECQVHPELRDQAILKSFLACA